MDCLWDLLVLVSLAGLVIFAVYGVCNTANESRDCFFVMPRTFVEMVLCRYVISVQTNDLLTN